MRTKNKVDSITINGHVFCCYERPGLGGLLQMDGLSIMGQGEDKPAIVFLNWPNEREATADEQTAIEQAWQWVTTLRHDNMPRE